VYANLAGNLAKMATTIVEAMNESKVERLIWISSYGIYQNEYHEIPNQPFGSINPALVPYRESALIVEGSNLKYTIIRPCWFSNVDEIDYELTQKGEAFKNPSGLISRKSIAHLVVRLALEPDFGIRQSLGINKP
ncbi:MAG: NAD(P)H-binding protein, partial [Helicobacter sp.]|nr:NAD(P)H-binding protein [Helicobacter sp.]